MEFRKMRSEFKKKKKHEGRDYFYQVRFFKTGSLIEEIVTIKTLGLYISNDRKMQAGALCLMWWLNDRWGLLLLPSCCTASPSQDGGCTSRHHTCIPGKKEKGGWKVYALWHSSCLSGKILFPGSYKIDFQKYTHSGPSALPSPASSPSSSQ